MLNKFLEAVEDMKEKQVIWNLADKEYEETAYHTMRAAEERVNAIIKEMKEGVKNDVCQISRQAI